MIVWAMASALASPCDEHALFVQGTSMTMTHYNRKGKVSTTVVSENREVRADGTASIHAETADKKGKDLIEVDYDVRCGDDGGITIDMQAFLPPDMVTPYGDQYDVDFESTELAFPASLSVGQDLPDATVTANLAMQGGAPSPLTNVKIDMQIQDRKVVAQESVTVPAGTFDAWKITSTSKVVTQTIMKVSAAMASTDWYVPGVGVVRSETFRGNGKQLGYSELTALSRGR